MLPPELMDGSLTFLGRMLLPLLSLCLHAHGDWVPVGPGGGSSSALLANGRLLLAKAPLGFFRSTDGAATWAHFPAPAEAISLAASGTAIFSASGRAGDSGGVWRSQDSGRTWNRLQPALPDSIAAGFDGSTTLLPYGRFLLAGTGHAVLRTADGGETWTRAEVQGFTPSLTASFSAIGPDLYANTFYGVARSIDSGATWTLQGSYPVSSHHLPMASPIAGDGNTLLADDGYTNTYRSIDSGASWTRIETLPRGSFASLVRSGADFLVSRDSLVFRSSDGGLNWTRIGWMDNFIARLYADGERLYARSYSGGIHRSDDGGATWTRSGMPGAKVAALWGSGSAVIAGFGEDLRFFRSTPHGSAWQTILYPRDSVLGGPWFPVANVKRFAGRENRVIGLHTTGSKLFHSGNGGESWYADSTDAKFHLITQAGPLIYATATLDGPGLGLGTYRSADGGANWAKVSVGLPGSEMAFLDTALFCAVGDGIFLSNLAGTRWAGARVDATGLSALAVCGRDVFAATAAGLYRSADTGSTWQLLRPDFRDISVLYAHGTVLFAGTASVIRGMARPRTPHRLMRSSDRGDTWVSIGEGIFPADITAMTVAGANLYVGTDGAGLWQRALAELESGALGVAPGRARSAGQKAPLLIRPGGGKHPVASRDRIFDFQGRKVEASPSVPQSIFVAPEGVTGPR